VVGIMRRFLYISVLVFVVCASLFAQDDDIPLGDLARALRNSKPPEQTDVIDNDNLDQIMDKAESERLEGQPIFSFTHAGTFLAISPDGSCSLSFDARNFNRTSAAYIATDLPQSELVKLEGPAAIEGGMLQVSVHNGTPWELKEIVVDVTLAQTQAPPEYRLATLQSVPIISSEKLPEPTLLYHVKGNAPPHATGTFRAALGDLGESLNNGKDWHWSIIGARGIPPAAQPFAAAENSLTAPGLVSPQPESRAEIFETDLGTTPPNSASVSSPSSPNQH
jgi:hypothetical protein